MVKSGDLSIRLYELLRDDAKTRTITDVRLGRAYIAVRLDDGRLGLSGFPTHGAGLPAPPSLPHDDGCPGLSDVPAAEPSGEGAIFPLSTTLIGASTAASLEWLTEKCAPLKKALALATANALIRQDHCDMTGDPFDLFHLAPEDKVAMVGRFTPLVGRVEDKGASLTVLEKDGAKGLVLSKRERLTILRRCTVAIITATALLYEDLEDILNDLGAPRHVALLGPSTPMLPDLFADTPVTHLGGVRITDAAQILPIVAAGGGTRAMRPYLEMTNLFLRK